MGPSKVLSISRAGYNQVRQNRSRLFKKKLKFHCVHMLWFTRNEKQPSRNTTLFKRCYDDLRLLGSLKVRNCLLHRIHHHDATFYCKCVSTHNVHIYEIFLDLIIRYTPHVFILNCFVVFSVSLQLSFLPLSGNVTKNITIVCKWMLNERPTQTQG